MSRGFVKEDDQEEVPLVPPRADLPAGKDNYVTPNGYKQLLEERKQLLEEQDNLDTAQAKEYRIAFNHLNARLALLNERIASAKIIDTAKFPKNEVHFGALVKFKNLENNSVQSFQIVGVDEASIAKGKISFVTPLAKALMYKKIGERAVLNLGSRTTTFEIIEISY